MHRSGGSHTWPQTHPNLPQGTTHPNLPQGKELVTPTKRCQPTAEIVVQGNLHLPYYYICKKNKRDKISLIT